MGRWLSGTFRIAAVILATCLAAPKAEAGDDFWGQIIFIDIAAFGGLSDTALKRDLYGPIERLPEAERVFVIRYANGTARLKSLPVTLEDAAKSSSVINRIDLAGNSGRNAPTVTFANVIDNIERAIGTLALTSSQRSGDVHLVVFANNWGVRDHEGYRMDERNWPDECIDAEFPNKTFPQGTRLAVEFRPSSAQALPSANAMRALLRAVSANTSFSNIEHRGIVHPGCSIPQGAGSIPGSSEYLGYCEPARLVRAPAPEDYDDCGPVTTAIAPAESFLPLSAIQTPHNTISGDLILRAPRHSSMRAELRAGDQRARAGDRIPFGRLGSGSIKLDLVLVNDDRCQSGGNISLTVDELGQGGTSRTLKQVDMTVQCGPENVERIVSLGRVEVQ